MTKRYMDIGFIVPLKEEFTQLCSKFNTRSEGVLGAVFYAELDLGVESLSGAAFLQDDMGKAAAHRATEALLDTFDVGLIIVVGIAGGLSADAAVGDVCFSGAVIDVLENMKISDTSAGGSRIEFNSKFYNTDRLLSFAFKYIELSTGTKPLFEEWQLQQHYNAKADIPGEFIGRDNKNEELGLPAIHEGTIVCGMVSKSEFYRSNLTAIERKALALETEAAAVFDAAQSVGSPVIAVRGICDYADKNKNKLEEQTGGLLRKIAANNAITFVTLQLKNPQLRRFLEQRRANSRATIPLFEGLAPVADGAHALVEAKETIHERLTQLSPQYHGKPSGYRLPLPRVRRSPLMASVSPALRKTDPISILEAITVHRIVVLDIPRNYPDNTLPWLVASELCLVEIDGKQTVPVVIAGESIRPPHGTIAAHSEMGIEALNASDRFRPVAIIEEFPATSRSRVEHLKKEIEKYPEAKFVIMNRKGVNVAGESNLLVLTGAEQVDICDISFGEMTDFFQRSFHMPDQEAGVIALKLRKMFRVFKLNAHPSYFAGVGGEVLSALLRANRRSELIQIAVGGFLSFVVASDDDEIILSRTTREEFLRKLTFEKRVLGKSLDRGALVAFVENFADSRDYAVDALKFVSAFQDRGLIHFGEDGVEVSLPFVEAYLLASELVAQPDAALAYFDLEKPNFDLITFDIYAELGPSEDVATAIIKILDDTNNMLALGVNTPHILTTNEIHPAMVAKNRKRNAIEQRLRKAFEDVSLSRPNSAEKARLLDAAMRIEDSAKSEQEKARSSRTKDSGPLEAKLHKALVVFGAATVLLGSGSERLNKKFKRSLAAKIVKLTSSLLDALLRSFPKIDFEALKSTLQSKEGPRDTDGDDGLTQRFHELVIAVLEAYEFSLLGYPIRALFSVLGDAAGQPVLGTSIADVTSTDVIEELVARVWAAEINAKKEIAALIRVIDKLPVEAFLRQTLFDYFMARVYWNHWDRKNQLALLDAAEKVIEPLNLQIDRGRVKRHIDKRAKR